MQLKDEIEFAKVRTAGEGQIAVETMRQGLELQELTLAHRRREDEYPTTAAPRSASRCGPTVRRSWSWTTPR